MVIADFNTSWVGCDTNVSFQNLSISNSPITYQWDFGDATTSSLENPIHNYAQAGNYTVTLIATSPGACNVSDTITKQVYILANTSDTIPSIVKCKNDLIQIGLLPVNDPTISYLWFPATDLSSANVSNPFCSSSTNTTYQLLVSNGSCTDTLTQNIIITSFSLDPGEDTSYCNTPITLQASYSGATDILWSSNINFTDTLSLTGNLTVASIAQFYVKVTDGICERVDSVRVNAQSINFNLIGENLCQGDSVFLLVENLMPSVAITSYSWEPLAITYNPDSSSISSYTDTSIWYSVEAINADGCILKDSIFIEIFDNPIIDALWLKKDTIFRGESDSLSIKTDDSFVWYNFISTDATVLVEPIQNECYTVEVFNANCSVIDSVCIVVLDVFCNEDGITVPTAFSPNEDGVNDIYFIVVKDEVEIVTDFKLEIFNRLGQRVFIANDISTHWDGTFFGKKLNPQVFDFYLELKCVDDKILFKKGNITLIR